MKPVAIGIVASVLALLAGCSKQADLAGVSPDKVAPIQIGVMQTDVEADYLRPPLLSQLPVDDQAKRLGTKAYTKVATSLYRNPRPNAAETYRIPAGTALWITPTSNRDWMQVRLSRGRSAYVRTGDTSAAMALAIAQGKLADQARLSPRPKAPNEADAGDGRSSAAPATNPALDQAIEDATTAFDAVLQQMDRLSAEYSGFQGDQSGWPTVREGFNVQLSQLVSDLQAFGQAVNGIAAHSSGMSGNDRSAFQSIVNQLANANETINSARTLVDQMREGQDWTSLVQSLGERMSELSSSIDSIETSLGRMA
jgi:hypothetical protein